MKNEDWEELRDKINTAVTWRENNSGPLVSIEGPRIGELLKRIEKENHESAGLLLMALKIVNAFRPKKSEDVRWLRKWVDGTNDFLTRRTK